MIDAKIGKARNTLVGVVHDRWGGGEVEKGEVGGDGDGSWVYGADVLIITEGDRA